MNFSSKRRFLAGAVCPRCSALDKLVVYSEEGVNYRECVACGFKDEMRFPQAPRELDTRVATQSESQPVKILTPPSSD